MDKTSGASDAPWQELIQGAIDRGIAPEKAKKQSRSRSRHADILQAAVLVFARDGIARARIVDIAAEAGVPLSSVYDYYPNKEDIAYAVPVARMGDFFAEFVKKARSVRTARLRVHLFLWLTVDFARRNQDWARTLYLEVWPSVLVEKTDLTQTLDDYGRVLLALITEGSREGEWALDTQPYQTVTIFIGSVNQLIITWLLYKKPKHLMKAAGPLVDRLLTLLGPVPAGAQGATKRGGVRSRRVAHA